MWYKFEDNNQVGIPRIKQYQVAWYDMTRDGKCFDEAFYSPYEIDKAITYVETVEDVENSDRARVFAHFDDGDVYELKLIKLSDEQVNERRHSDFYG